VQTGGGHARSDERSDDGAGRGAGYVGEAEAPLLEHRDGTDERDALHASTFEHEIDGLGHGLHPFWSLVGPVTAQLAASRT
jgi:hypothetical protein